MLVIVALLGLLPAYKPEVAVTGTIRNFGSALGGLVKSRGRDTATVLFTASAIAVLLPPAMFATFDWRYQLPQLSLIPVAAVLGWLIWPVGLIVHLVTRPKTIPGQNP